MKSMLNIRTSARIVAKVEIETLDPHRSYPIARVAECLDEAREAIFDDEGNLVGWGELRFAHLSAKTQLGAVRAAARELGRYDAERDEIAKVEVES